MKIKRFVAADMRQAMRAVREEQGPDAVILSTRNLADGIEIIAAVDYDEALVREAAGHGAQPPRPRDHAAPTGPAVRHEESSDDTVVQLSRAATVAAHQHTPATPVPAATDIAPATLPTATPAPRQGTEFGHMQRELGSLREMLETQMASLAWNDFGRRHPLRARVLRELTRLGLDGDIAQSLAADLPVDISAEQARYLPLGLLSRRIAVSGRELTDVGGALALVGPTGVGKTTTIAKLAARAVMRHGAGRVALISTDHYRIGAGAQLGHYGRLLGVPVYNAHDANGLRDALRQLTSQHTVLVDTAGMGASDPRLGQQLEVLGAGLPTMRACLVLAANAQAQSLDEAVRAYMPLAPQSCILTKLDESPLLGGALSVLIRHQLVLDYTTDGQRVPEDIHAADARQLVCRATRSRDPRGNDSQDNLDDIILAERFGRTVAVGA